MNKKWKYFDDLTGKYYLNMAGAERDGSCWQQAVERDYFGRAKE